MVHIFNDSHGDTNSQGLFAGEYLKEMRIDFIDTIDILKNIRSSWKKKLIVAVDFEYHNDDKKVETKISIHCIK